MSELTTTYTPRPIFMPFHERLQRWAVVVAHRRFGKTVGTINDAVSMAVYTQKQRARYGYIAPFYSMAKQIAWDYLVEYTADYAEKVSVSSLSVDLFNGARISLYGADNPDSMRGLYFDGVVLDEYGMMKPNLWTEIIRPTLADRQGWATFIGTPAGLNHFYDIREHARAHPDTWFYLELPYTLTGVLPEEEIEQMRALMDEDEFERELMCSFSAATRGAIYGREMKKAQIGDFPVDMKVPCNYVFDLGYTDTTAVWRWQEYEDAIEANLAFEQDGQAITYWINWLHEQRMAGFVIGDVWLPHDALAKSLQTGRSIVEQFLSNGIRPKIVPKLDLLDGIQATRLMLPDITFDEVGCKDGILALRSYRKTWNAEKKEYSQKPLHDWASNFSDSFRYLCLVAKKAPKQASKRTTPHARTAHYGFTMDEAWKCPPPREEAW